MKGDFSRVTFDPRRHFTRVLMQQGRVQLDADWNEQAAILLHYLQALGEDLIGPFGGPVFLLSPDGRRRLDNHGFLVAAPEPGEHGSLDFAFGYGRYYVDGLLCEHEPPLEQPGEEKNPPPPPSYYNQPYYPIYPKTDKFPDGPFLAYLDVWERHVTSLDVPATRETALGGPDTCSRAQVVWQVRAYPLSGDQVKSFTDTPVTDFNSAWYTIEGCLGRLGQVQMKATAAAPEGKSEDPCVLSPEARYRGLENQLYRVEVHTGGVLYPPGTAQDPACPEGDENAVPTFKWSRDNGSIVAAWVGQAGSEFQVSGVWDRGHSFAAGDWVEALSEAEELLGRPGRMARLERVEGDCLTFDPASAVDPIQWEEGLVRPRLRRWDQRGEDLDANGGVIPIELGKDYDLEDGIQVSFGPLVQDGKPLPAIFRPGDYWLVPARTLTGEIEWPYTEDPNTQERTYLYQPPQGIEHHYAPLALLARAGEGFNAKDLRVLFDWQKPHVT